MNSKTNWRGAPNARQEAKTLLDSGQQITFTVYSCPKCSDRFGFGRGVFGGHATEENLESLRQNPSYGAECELYKHLEGAIRASSRANQSIRCSRQGQVMSGFLTRLAARF